MGPPASQPLVRTGLSVLSPSSGHSTQDGSRLSYTARSGTEPQQQSLETLFAASPIIENRVTELCSLQPEAGAAVIKTIPTASKRQFRDELSCLMVASEEKGAGKRVRSIGAALLGDYRAPASPGSTRLRVYALRHQLRDPRDASFASPLLPEGVREAESTTRQLLKAAAPTRFYSSPFLRCLETLEPYVRRHGGGPIRVDYSLWEHNLDPKVKDVVNAEEGQPVPPEWQERFPLNEAYAGVLPRQALPAQNRTLADVHQRTRAFMEHLVLLHDGKPNVVVLCTHQTIVHSLLHQATGVPMCDLNVKMGDLVEIEWRMVTGMKW